MKFFCSFFNPAAAFLRVPSEILDGSFASFVKNVIIYSRLDYLLWLTGLDVCGDISRFLDTYKKNHGKSIEQLEVH